MIEEYIWVFKTNIKHEDDVRNISDIMECDHIIQWTIDADDCDAVLRVVTLLSSPEEIISKITNKGYLCSELAD